MYFSIQKIHILKLNTTYLIDDKVSISRRFGKNESKYGDFVRAIYMYNLFSLNW